MKEAVGKSSQDFMLDGFPRSVAQADVLDSFLSGIGRKLDSVLYLELPMKEAVRRLTARRMCPACKAGYNVITLPPAEGGLCKKCGSAVIQRPDDNEQTVMERLKVYENETLPLVEHYRKQGKVLRVNADNTIENIIAEIRGKFAK
jgi:adenylate kinase